MTLFLYIIREQRVIDNRRVNAIETGTDINLFRSSGLFYHNSRDRPISSLRVSGLLFFFPLLLSIIIKIPILNANSVNSDQTPRSAASDLGLHCFLMSLFWDARYI